MDAKEMCPLEGKRASLVVKTGWRATAMGTPIVVWEAGTLKRSPLPKPWEDVAWVGARCLA